MKASLQEKLLSLLDRHEELAALLASPEVAAGGARFRELSKEYAAIEPLVVCYQQYQKAEADKAEADVLQQDPDPELKTLAKAQGQEAAEQLSVLERELMLLMIPVDPSDERNVYLEIRAGTGGDEAAIFAGDLFRMYSRYSESRGWQLEVVSCSDGEKGGYKEIISRISGNGVYAALKFESGAHRVQRVPETEAQGRVHTSACTVAVLPEVDSIDEVTIRSEDCRVDTYRSSGAGGQHVNKTDSAIRITHLPTGIVVECQEERSQHKNRAKAMALLQSRILAQEQARQQQEQATTRRLLVGTGDRSERIRTYNYPQGRLTDHRINLTLYQLESIMEGDLNKVLEPLRHENQMDALTELGLAPNE